MFYPLQTIIGRYDRYRLYKQQTQQKKHQNTIFSDIIKQAAQTAFGKEHGITTDTDYHHFIQQLPIYDYDQFKPWIEKAKTQANILRPEKINRFAASSGTTSAKKHIPLTDACIQSTHKAGKDVLTMLISKYTDIQPLQIYNRPLGWSIQDTLSDGTTIADISAHMIQTTPQIYKKYLFPEPTLLLADWKNKREIFASELTTDKKTIILWVTSRIVEMGKYLHTHYPKKREELQENIEAIIRWWVSIKPFIQQFSQRNITRHIGVYNASEWFFGYQNIRDFDNSTGNAPYVLTTNHGIFYEFVPVNSDNFDKNNTINPQALSKRLQDISQEDINHKQRFALIITSNTGLYRYMIGDVIRFVDTKGHFIIEGRTKQSLNLKGEELMIDHTESAVAQANQKYTTQIQYYSIWPDQEDNPDKHHRVIEWLDSQIAWEWIQYVDLQLQEINADYKAKRTNDILLQCPSYDIVPIGTFHTRLQQNKKLWGQSKTIKLAADRKIIEELMQINHI